MIEKSAITSAISAKRASAQSTFSPRKRLSTRLLIGTSIGTALEWYDFIVFGFMASVLGKQFFPQDNEVTQLLSVFLAFGAGYVMRPLGGLVIGRLGDVKGRRPAMIVTLLSMGIATLALGLLPNYASIGIAAPSLMVVCRLVQGFSAGGEYGGAGSFLVEWAPEGRRGLFGSIAQALGWLGLLLGSAASATVVTIFTPAQVDDWAWRLPFLIGAAVVPVGLVLRLRLEETPPFLESKAMPGPPTPSREKLVAALRLMGINAYSSTLTYFAIVYLPSVEIRLLGISRSEALWVNSASLAVMTLLTPIMGRLSDTIGRKPQVLIPCLATPLLGYLILHLAATNASSSSVFAVQLAIAFFAAVFTGILPTLNAELFRTKDRSTWFSTNYSITGAIFGGFTPFAATWLVSVTDSPVSPAYLLAGIVVFALVALVNLPEPARKPLM